MARLNQREIEASLKAILECIRSHNRTLEALIERIAKLEHEVTARNRELA